MSTSGCSKARTRGDDRVGLRALRVVDVAHAVDLGDRLEAVLDPAEATHGAAMASGATPWSRPTATAARTLETLCSPGMGMSASGRMRPSCALGRGQLGAGHDPAVDHADAAGRRGRARVGARSRAPAGAS